MAGSDSNQAADRSNRGVGELADGFRRARRDHSVETAEDYLELIADLIREDGEARLVDVAKCMGVSHVTANRTIARLQREGLVEKRPYRSIFLTEAGEKLAEDARERHELVYSFLRAIGVPEKDAHLDSEGIEHHIGQKTLKAMSRFVKKHERESQ